MGDPRVANTNRIGTGQDARTYKADGTDIVFDATQPGGSAVVGRAVMLSGNGIIRLTGAGSPVMGKLAKVEWDGYCTVIDEGVVTLPKGDGTIAVGQKIVGDTLSAARGYIRGTAATTGSYVQGTATDALNGSGEVMDVSDPTAIEVELE